MIMVSRALTVVVSVANNGSMPHLNHPARQAWMQRDTLRCVTNAGDPHSSTKVRSAGRNRHLQQTASWLQHVALPDRRYLTRRCLPTPTRVYYLHRNMEAQTTWLPPRYFHRIINDAD